jgi:large subunit ribosomal protein L5
MKELTSIERKYKEQVLPKWMEEKSYKSVMAVPKLKKVVLNMGLGAFKEAQGEVDTYVEQLERIAGQKPVVTVAKQSIAGFNLREGMKVGAKVTLRGNRMYAFLEKVFNYVLPRTRDFQGLSPNGFDGHGNYSFGLEDQMLFLEIDPNKVRRRQGLQVTIDTSAQSDSEAKELLLELGLPLKKNDDESEDKKD